MVGLVVGADVVGADVVGVVVGAEVVGARVVGDLVGAGVGAGVGEYVVPGVVGANVPDACTRSAPHTSDDLLVSTYPFRRSLLLCGQQLTLYVFLLPYLNWYVSLSGFVAACGGWDTSLWWHTRWPKLLQGIRT